MTKAIKIEVQPEDIIEAVKKMKKREREAFLEDLLAAIRFLFADTAFNDVLAIMFGKSLPHV